MIGCSPKSIRLLMLEKGGYVRTLVLFHGRGTGLDGRMERPRPKQSCCYREALKQHICHFTAVPKKWVWRPGRHELTDNNCLVHHLLHTKTNIVCCVSGKGLSKKLSSASWEGCISESEMKSLSRVSPGTPQLQDIPDILGSRVTREAECFGCVRCCPEVGLCWFWLASFSDRWAKRPN